MSIPPPSPFVLSIQAAQRFAMEDYAHLNEAYSDSREPSKTLPLLRMPTTEGDRAVTIGLLNMNKGVVEVATSITQCPTLNSPFFCELFTSSRTKGTPCQFPVKGAQEHFNLIHFNPNLDKLILSETIVDVDIPPCLEEEEKDILRQPFLPIPLGLISSEFHSKPRTKFGTDLLLDIAANVLECFHDGTIQDSPYFRAILHFCTYPVFLAASDKPDSVIGVQHSRISSKKKYAPLLQQMANNAALLRDPPSPTSPLDDCAIPRKQRSTESNESQQTKRARVEITSPDDDEDDDASQSSKDSESSQEPEDDPDAIEDDPLDSSNLSPDEFDRLLKRSMLKLMQKKEDSSKSLLDRLPKADVQHILRGVRIITILSYSLSHFPS